MDSEFSLYIHIPFCSSFCDYCDFYSVKTENISDEYIDNYLCAIINDIKNQIKHFSAENIVTAYIGGGTPSVLEKKIGFLIKELNKIPCFKPEEFTIEANPESLTEDFLRICRENGVNRLSLGVQTFHEPSRKQVNRKGDINIINKNISLASEYYKNAVSFDLITGLPYQNEDIIKNDINKILAFNPCHVSLYSLTIEDDTLLKEKINKKLTELPAGDKADSLWIFGRNILIENGFKNYEISNFAKEGSECKHNLRYWNMESWLAAGAASCATIINNKKPCASRFTRANDIDAYIKNHSLDAAIFEEINRDTLLKESLLMGFRCKEQPFRNIFKERFGITIEDCIPDTLLKYSNADIMLFLNSFIADAFKELDSKKL